MKIFLFTFIIFSVGCATGTPYQRAERTNENNSMVYIYRPYKFGGAAASPKVYINDVSIGLLRAGNYLWVELEDGEHDILVGKKKGEWVNWAPDSILQKIIIEPGREYYFRMNIDNGDIGFFVIPMPYAPMVITHGTSNIKFEMIDPAEAKKEIINTKYYKEVK